MVFFPFESSQNKLPTDDRIVSFGNPTVTRWVCCTRPTSETIEHIFSQENLAKTVWKEYGGPAGIRTDNMPLMLILMN